MPQVTWCNLALDSTEKPIQNTSSWRHQTVQILWEDSGPLSDQTRPDHLLGGGLVSNGSIS